MKWEDITPAFDGFTCTVLFDGPEHPYEYKRYDGKIKCQGPPGTIPLLLEVWGSSIMNPPRWATVIIHTPELTHLTW